MGLGRWSEGAPHRLGMRDAEVGQVVAYHPMTWGFILGEVIRRVTGQPAASQLGSRSYPVQVVWAAQDPAMPISTYGAKARAAACLTVIDRIPGKHFPQEDQAPAIATRVASIALAREKNAPS